MNALGALLGVLESFLGSSAFEIAFSSNFFGFSSILGGFWHLSRLRGVFLFDDGLQTLWQTLKQGPVAAAEVVWNLFDGQNVRLGTFGT